MTNEDFDAFHTVSLARVIERVGMTAAAAAVLAVAGCTLVDRTNDPTPSPAGTTSAASASPTSSARGLTEAQLLTADDIPVVEKESYAETPEGVGRGPEELTVCRPEDAGSAVSAEDVLSRNFRLATRADGEPAAPEPPLGEDPTIYTQALQFGSPEAASAAYETYRGWLEACRKTITQRGDSSPARTPEWHPVQTDIENAKVGFTEVIWIPADDESGSGYFESVGLALVGDRLAVLVSLVYGQDYNVAFEQEGDPDLGLPPHPQYGLLAAAADRLDRG